MDEHPDIFRQFAGAYKFLTSLSSARMVFAEFQKECRDHDAQLTYLIVDEPHECDNDSRYGAQPPSLPPSLLLTARQVPVVCQALWQRFAVVLSERVTSVHATCHSTAPIRPVEISATQPFIEDSNDEPAPSVQECARDFVQGGGVGSQKRKRVKSPSRSPPPQSAGLEHHADDRLPLAVFWPVWSLHIDDDISVVHVSVEHAAPIDVEIPASWTVAETEAAFAHHVAAKMEWIDFTW
eukprot:5392515-Amphidinium_carterae.1